MKALIVANWKMNPTSRKQAKELFDAIKKGVKSSKSEVVICPPFVYLPLLKGLTLGAQNCFYEDSGTFTGKVSALMLKDIGVEYVIIGHSEIRKMGEADETINKKIKKVLATGLKVILCVGENYDQKERGETENVLKSQLEADLKGITVQELIDNFTVAYEPVWAISGGDPYKTKELPTPEKVEKIHSHIRSILAKMYGQEFADGARIIYGGSSNAGNAKGYLEKAKVQGFLVGGASLRPDDFSQIVKSAE